MTVKCLAEHQKLMIAAFFTNGDSTINELTVGYAVSRRTIIRVLEERGIDPGIRTRKKKEPRPGLVVIPTKTPWYRRILDRMSEVGRGLGINA